VRQAAEAHGGSVVAENASGGGALLRISFARSVDQLGDMSMLHITGKQPS
jgi:signal transduction histidine kinase